MRRLKDAGFVVVGKSNTPEFGITSVTESDLNGACLQSVGSSTRTPGGSSGGAAAAVAAGRARARARLGRRRLDPDPGLVLRPLRPEAVARARLAGAVRQRLARALAERADLGDRARCRGLPRRRRRVRVGRRERPAAARAAVPRGGRPRPGAAAHRVHRRAADPLPGRAVSRRRRTRCRGRARATSAIDVVERTPPWRDDEPAPHVRDALADLAGAVPRARPLAADAAQPHARGVGRRDVECSPRRGDGGPAARRAPGRRLLAGRRRRPDAGAREAARADRLGLRARGSLGAVRRGGEFTPFTPVVNVTGQPAACVPVRRRRRAPGRGCS